jgi:hypothetical protein
MPPADGHRLFHAIVLMGVSLTGGAVASCGGSTATLSDAGPHDGAVDDAYNNIGVDAYGQISFNQPDVYDHIDAAAVDHYSGIHIDSGVEDSPHDAPADVPGDDGCYPCIAPVQWDT